MEKKHCINMLFNIETGIFIMKVMVRITNFKKNIFFEISRYII